ncbi:MAG: DUF359 domain-containing protein [Candidatus Caldarchaeum sp.]
MTDLWKKPIIFTEQLREEVRKPFGELKKGDIQYNAELAIADLLVVVGDYSFRKLVEAGIRPHVVVVDAKIERGVVGTPDLAGYSIVKVRNQAGMVEPEAAAAVVEAIMKRGGAVLVDGEEDLLALPAMYALPNGGLLIYGQPKVGYVVVRGSEEVRRKVVEIVNRAIP